MISKKTKWVTSLIRVTLSPNLSLFVIIFASTSYKAFYKKKKRSRTSLPILFSA